MLKSKYLVITFQSSGALFVVNNDENNFEYTLIFWRRKDGRRRWGNRPGQDNRPHVFFTAAFASQIYLAKKDKHYKIDNAIKAGLTAIRLFYEIGYVSANGGVRYPFAELSKAPEVAKDFTYSSAPVPKPDVQLYGQKSEWSILIDNYSEETIKKEIQIKALTALAKNIVLKGPEYLKIYHLADLEPFHNRQKWNREPEEPEEDNENLC